MVFKTGDIIRLGPYTNYRWWDHPEAYKQGNFTEGMVVGRSFEKPEVVLINYRNDPSLFSGGVENMFNDSDLEQIPGNPYEEKERIFTMLFNKGYKQILEERSII